MILHQITSVHDVLQRKFGMFYSGVTVVCKIEAKFWLAQGLAYTDVLLKSALCERVNDSVKVNSLTKPGQFVEISKIFISAKVGCMPILNTVFRSIWDAKKRTC